jgi:hypothetical protein
MEVFAVIVSTASTILFLISFCVLGKVIERIFGSSSQTSHGMRKWTIDFFSEFGSCFKFEVRKISSVEFYFALLRMKRVHLVVQNTEKRKKRSEETKL